MKKYPWYSIVSGTEKINQGDFIKSCPLVTPPININSNDVTEVKAIESNVIVLSQSCDIENNKIAFVLVCPYRTLTEMSEKEPFFSNKDGKEKLRQGYQPGYCLLNKCLLSDFTNDFIVVDFRNVYGVPLDYLVDFSKRKRRLRLMSPYREHLSYAFGRFFMRVGLPEDIPRFI